MHSLSSGSYWHASAPAPLDFPRLDGDREADVLIIGAGITGLTAAMHLQSAGRQVVVIEAGRVGAGTTGGTSGHLEALPDQGIGTLISDFGATSARAVTQARIEAIDQIEAWCRELQIDCDFRRIPAYAYTESPDRASKLESEFEQVGELGLVAAPVDGAALGLPFPCARGFRIEGQARFHSLRYLRALADSLRSAGCAIYEQTRAQPPEEDEPCTVETDHGRIAADHVLLCTHSAFLGVCDLDMRVAAYQSYVMTVRAAQQIPDALYWDDAEPYHYTRLASSDDPHLLMVGGADHKTGQGGDEREAYARLESYVRERFDVREIEQRWSAEFFEPVDGLPYIGRVPFHEHTYIGTGYSGTGLTFGTVAGRLLADLILGRETPLADIFTPSRIKPLASAADFVSENVNVARRYVADRFSGKSVESLEEVGLGEGALVRYRGNQWAVYRDEQGGMHVFSPECTHAGCHVQWNEAEQTWDCPCHGGRYSALGERLYGPPPKDLESKPLSEL